MTIPLQRHLNRTPPPYGMEQNRRFCWDLHVISLRGRKSLLAVQCGSRYAFVLYDPPAPAWADLPHTFLSGLRHSLSAAGIAEGDIDSYLLGGGDISLTRTHGRREVAFLNRAWDDVMALDCCLDEASCEQPLLDYAVNRKASRCAGFEGLAPAAERMKKSLK